MTQSLPIVRLRPKAEARAIRHGFPWVYADELVTDRRTQALAPGTIALLEDAERRPLGIVTVNPASKIVARVLDRDAAAMIGRDWIAARIARALSLRERLYDAPFYRLVHAEADGLPGVVIDRFGAAAVIQPNAAWAEAMIGDLAGALAAVTGVTTIVKNGTGRARGLEGLVEETVVLSGALDEPVPVPMNGAVYMADLLGGQKTGLFFDQRENHAFAARLAKGLRCSTSFRMSAASRWPHSPGARRGRWPSTARPRRSSLRGRGPRRWGRARGSRRARAMPSRRWRR